MEFYEWFIQMCEKNNESPSYAANKIGVSAAAASGWKHGGTPKPVTLLKLEKHFGEKFNPVKNDDDRLQNLKDNERILLHGFNSMTNREQEAIINFLKEYIKHDD